jgi:hypothetical protein
MIYLRDLPIWPFGVEQECPVFPMQDQVGSLLPPSVENASAKNVSEETTEHYISYYPSSCIPLDGMPSIDRRILILEEGYYRQSRDQSLSVQFRHLVVHIYFFADFDIEGGIVSQVYSVSPSYLSRTGFFFGCLDPEESLEMTGERAAQVLLCLPALLARSVVGLAEGE